MSLVDNINITKYICLQNGESVTFQGQINYNPSYEDIENLVLNFIEKSTGCTIFNKSNLLSEIKNNFENHQEDLLKIISNIINKNLIPQINFDSMFKLDLNFTLVFNQDEIIILYKNKKVELKSIIDIKKDLLENKSNYLPIITELFINNIGNIIEKLIKKDLTVKYHLIDIPTPYWKLFEIKSKRINKKIIFDQNLEDIISGKNYLLKINEDSEPDDELKAVLMQIEEYEKNASNNNNLTDVQKQEQDILYRMEVMSYLNDDEMNYFLETLEHIDDQEKNIDLTNNKSITLLFGEMLNVVTNTSNKMIKYYGVYRLFTFLLKNENFLLINDIFRKIAYKKAIELLTYDIVIIQSTGLEISKELTDVLYKTKDLIIKIDEKKYGKLVENISESEEDNNFYSDN
jgi:hypothetical protein